ncbi:hypothetical protein MTO96_015776 [Rhipicephalus appendiculatus]
MDVRQLSGTEIGHSYWILHGGLLEHTRPVAHMRDLPEVSTCSRCALQRGIPFPWDKYGPGIPFQCSIRQTPCTEHGVRCEGMGPSRNADFQLIHSLEHTVVARDMVDLRELRRGDLDFTTRTSPDMLVLCFCEFEGACRTKAIMSNILQDKAGCTVDLPGLDSCAFGFSPQIQRRFCPPCLLTTTKSTKTEQDGGRHASPISSSYIWMLLVRWPTVSRRKQYGGGVTQRRSEEKKCATIPSSVAALSISGCNRFRPLRSSPLCATLPKNVGEYPDKHIWVNRYILPDLRSIYVELAYDTSFHLFAAILRQSLNLNDLHVHFLRGSFQNALIACKVLCEQATRLEKFTFTSEQSPYCQQLSSPLEFVNCASVCANIECRQSSGFMSFFAFHDLGEDWDKRRCMPNTTIAAAVHNEGDCLAPELMRVAFYEHDWSWINRVCFVLLPEDPSSLVYPQAGRAYRDSLLLFFTYTFRYLLELNISSFHFGPDIDVVGTASGSHAGKATAPAHCQDFRELDVRYETRGGLIRCPGCEGDVPLDPEAPATFPGGSAGFRNGLVRLTLCGLRFPVCQHFIECCGPTTTLRLSDACPNLSIQHYTHLAEVLSERSAPICLVLRHECLRIHEASVVTTLPRLRFLHFHYMSMTGVDRSLTYMRGEDDPADEGYLLRNAPCFQCCSTATFIGLAKPMNREFVPPAQAQPW